VIAPLSPKLEQCFLHAVLTGKVPRESVKPEEVSKQGKVILTAVEKMASDGLKPPYKPESVYLVATEIFGSEKASLRQYLHKCVDAGTGAEIADIIKAVQDRSMLVNLVNAASEQLTKGSLDMGAINLVLSERRNSSTLVAAKGYLREGIPRIPTGIPIKSLPTLTDASGGLFGLWVIGGESGTGKSCLAWQIGLEAAREIPTIYYDFENGKETLLHRTGEICKGDINSARRALKRLYLRDHIRTLDNDVATLPAPALIVVDSLHKLPTSVLHRRTSLDQWLHKFESLVKQGYTVLLTSEKNRQGYGNPTAGGYKETSEIEYTASFGVQIIKTEDEEVKVFCVKNRHRPNTGLVCTLERHPKRQWWYREASYRSEDED